MKNTNILKIVDESQDLIRNIDGLTGSDAFEEVIKLFFTIKIINNENKTAQNIKEIYTNNVFTKYDFFIGNTIKLKDLTIESITNLFSQIDFDSDDIKGRIFETFLGRVFTSGLGQFFTPREIVDFMVQYLHKNNLISDKSIILDPACGSAGILIKSVKSNDNKILGYDINERLIRVSKMNMVLHNIHNYEIFNDSFLNENRSNFVDIVVTNPPFGVEEKQKKVLDKHVFGFNKKSCELEILFIEKIIKVLKPGGICCIVLPDGIFNNVTNKKIREYILTHCDLLSSVDLPENVFKSSGTGCETGILFFKKKEDINSDFKPFISYKVDYVGYETQTKFAKKIEKNDLLSIIQNKNYEKQTLVNKLDKSLRFDGKFYLRKKNNMDKPKLDVFLKSGVPIKKIYKSDDIIKYVQYSDIDPVFGVIKSSTNILSSEAPSRAKIVVRKNDILIPKLKQSLDKIAIVTDEFDGSVVTNGFIVIKANHKCTPEYLFGIFRKKQIKKQLYDFSSGTIMPSVDDEYIKELVYVPEINDEYNVITDKITKVFFMIDEAKLIMDTIQ